MWPSQDLYLGFAQTEALEIFRFTEKIDVVKYLEMLKEDEIEYNKQIKPLLEERSSLVRNGGAIEPLLAHLFSLKEEQRKIRKLIKLAEKVKNALEIKPCLIDYAVNFGINTTEVQWRTSLLKNDNLMLPTILNTKN
jgi:hypothetical protein